MDEKEISKIEEETATIEDKSLWKKLSKYAQKAGIKVVYSVLLLYYAFKRKETPAWAKKVIVGIIGYFIAPIDALPDLTPFIGYTDDLGVLGFGLVTIAAYINEDVRKNARGQLTKWFGEYDQKELESVDKKL